MTFDWCCLVSSRLGKRQLAVAILEDFRVALSDELELQVDEPLYVSTGELKAGDRIDPALERALCKSACMVILFTGHYFSATHPYCTREYLAMRTLEEMRLAQLDRKEHGLIIPVVLRDLARLPKELTDRMWLDFQAFQQKEGGIAKPEAYYDKIRELATYIAARCRQLSAIPEDEKVCRDFRFPDAGEAREFVMALPR